MTVNELAAKLKNMYESSKNHKAAMIRLSGIIYSREMKNAGVTAVDVLRAAGMQESYHAEINKGTNFARYVELKGENKDKF